MIRLLRQKNEALACDSVSPLINLLVTILMVHDGVKRNVAKRKKKKEKKKGAFISHSHNA
jgi:hypothetical protein